MALGAVAWLSIVALGMRALLEYQARPGDAAQAPARWPARSTLVRHPGAATLVLFAHPKCPCTRASLGELERSLAHAKKPIDAWIVLVLPRNADPSWAQSDLVLDADQIPHARVWVDRGGTEAHRFGAHTSGQVLLYDAAGKLCFAGGITPGRGHMGDNAGGDAVADLVGGPMPLATRSDSSRTPVFGCALFDASDEPGEQP
jgi:hypothetical protein